MTTFLCERVTSGVCHSLVCSRFCLPFLLRWVPEARSGRKRCLLLSYFRHLSGSGLCARLAHDLLGAVVTSFWVVATGVDLDDKEGCSSSTPGGPHYSRPEFHRTVLRLSSRFGGETEKSRGPSKAPKSRRPTPNRASISSSAARLWPSVVAGGRGQCLPAAL